MVQKLCVFTQLSQVRVVQGCALAYLSANLCRLFSHLHPRSVCFYSLSRTCSRSVSHSCAQTNQTARFYHRVSTTSQTEQREHGKSNTRRPNTMHGRRHTSVKLTTNSSTAGDSVSDVANASCPCEMGRCLHYCRCLLQMQILVHGNFLAQPC